MVLASCGGAMPDKAPMPKPQATPDAAVAAAPDAAVTPEATDGEPQEDPFPVLRSESFGPLKFGMRDVDVRAALGEPASRSEPWFEPATAAYLSWWSWDAAGVSIGMMATEKAGPYFASRSITISGRSKLTTKLGIGIGATRKDVDAKYPSGEWKRDDPTEPERMLVGSPYGGLLLFLDKERVASMSLGAFAF
jgi:hypothetical protein